MIARGGAMAAIDTSPLDLPSKIELLTPKILPPADHDCQPVFNAKG